MDLTLKTTAKNLGIISEFLETYKGRDKVLRALSYMAKMGTGLTTEETAKKLKIFGSQMSGCRVMLRLLDDIPMLHYALLYNSHYKDPDWVIRWIDIVQIVVDVIYYPIEHIWWAGELKLIAINKDAWDVGTTYFWLISLYLSLMRSLRRFNQLEKHTVALKEGSKEWEAAMKTSNALKKDEVLNCVRLALDISYAVSYLPSGTLWGGQMKTWQVGALGTITSVIGLYQAFSKQLSKKKSD